MRKSRQVQSDAWLGRKHKKQRRQVLIRLSPTEAEALAQLAQTYGTTEAACLRSMLYEQLPASKALKSMCWEATNAA